MSNIETVSMIPENLIRKDILKRYVESSTYYDGEDIGEIVPLELTKQNRARLVNAFIKLKKEKNENNEKELDKIVEDIVTEDSKNLRCKNMKLVLYKLCVDYDEIIKDSNIVKKIEKIDEKYSAGVIFNYMSDEDTLYHLKICWLGIAKIFLENEELKEELVLENHISISDFDCELMLKEYDINAINNSVIKYYKSVQKWVDDLIVKLEVFEKENEDIIREFECYSFKLTKKYEENKNLDEKENDLLKDRKEFLQKYVDIGIVNVKNRLLLVKKQANDLEDRIDDINDTNNSLELLSYIEEEKRASFSFIAENTSNMVKNLLVKIENFKSNKEFFVNLINSEDKWSENYKIFKTKYKEELKQLCEEYSIEEDIYNSWYVDLDNKKYKIEECFNNLIKQCVKKPIISFVEDNKYMVQKVIDILKKYKNDLEKFYKEEVKDIHQKYAFEVGGDINEKLEIESSLYKINIDFQNSLQDVIFKLDNTEERIFLVKWSKDICNMQLDEIIYFIKDKNFDEISKNMLSEFLNLKSSNIENYINDAKLYAKEKSDKEKEFNSLMYKMRKELKKAKI